MFSDANFGEVTWGLAATSSRFAAAVTTVCFDQSDEAIWIGTERGALLQQHSPSLEVFSCVAAHADRVHEMAAVPGGGCLSLSHTQVTLHSAGGIQRWCCRPDTDDLMSICMMPRWQGCAAVVDESGRLYSLSMATGRVTETIDAGTPLYIARPQSKGQIAVATGSGHVQLRDPRDGFRTTSAALAHSGGLIAMEVGEDLVATCGCGLRMQRSMLENSVKVFDIRMGVRALANLPFTPGPMFIKFHPMLHDTLLMGSSSGMFCMSDVQGMTVPRMHQVETEGDSLTAADISPSGDATVLGGSGGYVHLWGTSAMPRVNFAGRDLPRVPRRPPAVRPREEWEPWGPLPQHFCMEGKPLSEYVADSPIAVGRPPRIVPAEIAADLKTVDFVGYARNPFYSPNAPRGAPRRMVAPLQGVRLQPRAVTEAARAADRAERRRLRIANGGHVLPSWYKRMEIKKLQSNARFEDFDFSLYNKTKFAGLENDVANCYCNALIQVLFFVPALRKAILRTSPQPSKEFCLACELTFLFRMLDNNHGLPCQASNLLRALKHNKEASALGLLEGISRSLGTSDIELEASKDRSLSRRVQSLFRFLMEHLHKELASPVPGTARLRRGAKAKDKDKGKDGDKEEDKAKEAKEKGPASAPAPAPLEEKSPIERVFGIPHRQRIRCVRDGAQQVKESISFQVDLQYPAASERPAAGQSGAARPTFASLVRKSLRADTDMKAWFNESRGYTHVTSVRTPKRLPQVLAINCGLHDREDLCWWQPVEKEVTQADGRATELAPWLPEALEIGTDPEAWDVGVREAASRAELAASPKLPGRHATRATYELSAAIVHVADVDADVDGADAGAAAEGHLVAQIRVQPHYADPKHGFLRPAAKPRSPGVSPFPSRSASQRVTSASPAPPLRLPSDLDAVHEGDENKLDTDLLDVALNRLSTDDADRSASGGAASCSKPSAEWMVFNDFCITPCAASDVLELYHNQKVPCLLFYTQVVATDAANRMEPPKPVSNIADLYRLMKLPSQGTGTGPWRFFPLDPDTEAITPGTVMGIDAEFVALTPDEKVIKDNVEVKKSASTLGLGRVSVVRGQGERKFVPLIDDHIKTAETVYDYLTKYSGLRPGDLDPGSHHYLATLKTAYTKLRLLVDAGVTFVGHGLKKDFHMINIIVPPEQVIDTVELWWFKRNRKLSLRFLASYILGEDIQSDTHDSIEDACVALKLYDAYCELSVAGTFHNKLEEIYKWGKMYGWEPVTRDAAGNIEPPPPAPPPLP